MSIGPVIPGNRVYPGTSQHWTYGQVISYRDFLKAAVVLSAATLGAVAAIGLLTGVWA